MAKLYYDADADPLGDRRPQGGHHRLRLAGPRPRPQPGRLRGRRTGGPAPGISLGGQGGRGGACGDGRGPALLPAQADVVMILLPDTVQGAVWRSRSPPTSPRGTQSPSPTGSNIRFGQISPPPGLDVLMVAPKGPGHLVRRTYHRGRRRPGPGGGAPGRHREG